MTSAFVGCDRADDAPILARVAVLRLSGNIDNVDVTAGGVQFLNQCWPICRR